MIESGGESLPLLAEPAGEMLDLRPSRDEDRDTPLLLDHVPDEALVEELVRLER